MSATIDKLKKVIEAMQSAHVQSVEAGFEYEMDNIRYYSAVTYKSGEAHRYRVRVQDWYDESANEMQRIIKCNCQAGSKDMVCRHAVKVAEIDTAMTGSALYLDDLAEYKAHKCFEKKSAAAAFTTELVHICSFCKNATETGSDHWDCELGVADAFKAESARLQAKEAVAA